MFDLTLTGAPRFDVAGKQHRYVYATDGSAPNPLESTYAALAGCAGVYARKACKELGLDEAGIRISMKIVASPGRPLLPARVVTAVEFPDRFDVAQKATVLESIRHCAVKALIAEGSGIEFGVEETTHA